MNISLINSVCNRIPAVKVSATHLCCTWNEITAVPKCHFWGTCIASELVVVEIFTAWLRTYTSAFVVQQCVIQKVLEVYWTTEAYVGCCHQWCIGADPHLVPTCSLWHLSPSTADAWLCLCCRNKLYSLPMTWDMTWDDQIAVQNYKKFINI